MLCHPRDAFFIIIRTGVTIPVDSDLKNQHYQRFQGTMYHDITKPLA